MKRLLLLFFIIPCMAGQPALAAAEGSAEGGSAEQAPAEQGSGSMKSDRKKPAEADNEPECD